MRAGLCIGPGPQLKVPVSGFSESLQRPGLAAAAGVAHTAGRRFIAEKTMPPFRIRPLPLSRSCAALAAAALPALSALPAGTAAQTLQTGDVAVLASYYEIRGADCLALRAPRVVITQPPALGQAHVQQTRGQAGASGRCAYKAVPISQVVYQARQPGTDVLAWEVKYQDKSLGTRHYNARVGVTPAP